MYKIDWTLTAEQTYIKEIEFIEKKWGDKQIQDFILLVEKKIDLVRSGLITGKRSKIDNVRILVISEQTTLAYEVFEEELRIELTTFWNNQIDPEKYSSIFEIDY